MAKINILPAKVYNRIAAGEVVDRPYSVVKELVENAIDAGATDIEIHIEQGGKQLIRVIDNGCGIAREDLQSAFLPHATSKISKAEDLENILTLGFRGEAVASIASVSKMTITSKTHEGKCYALSSNGGELGQIVEAAGENGTDVKVEMLFFNAPVRLNFLKSDKAEETDITNYISRFILNRSDIAFTYYANGKKILQSFGGGDEEAMVSVYGASIISNCFRIDAERHGVRIRGYIGNQNFYKPNKSYQSVFLNGRYIINATVSAALSNAYASYLMKRQYPFYVLHINVPTEIVDVNVHPNKADVRFADNQIIYGCIYRVISSVLDGQTKALEYIVPDKNMEVVSSLTSAEWEEKENVAQLAPFAPVPTLQPNNSVSQTGNRKVFELSNDNDFAADSGRNTAKQQDMFGFKTLTYEEAKKEIENCAPKFVKHDETDFQKGFVPKSQIPPYVPTPNEEAGKPRKTGGFAGEKLHKHYPDLFFKKNVMEVDDPAYEKAKKEGTVEDYFEANKKYLEELDKKNKQNKIDISTCTYAGKLFNTYLLYECGNEVYIIDQHAAHERLIFNRLKEKMQNRTFMQQPMLLPYRLTLNAFEGTFIRERMEDIRAMGFDISEAEDNVFEVLAIPMDLQHIDLNSFFHDILGDISGFRSIKLEDLLKDKLATAACKAAVKGGMDLTNEEIDALFKLMDGDMGLKCPHGRPVVVKMTRTELEKMFKRIV